MRLVARIDVKNDSVIKGIHLEGLRKIGPPNEIALDIYNQGIDEIIFMDAVASLYDRNNLFGILEKACEEVFIPITIGGGIRTLEDVSRSLMSGADKVAVNSAAIRNPKFITEIALKYGSQCVVGSIEAKKIGDTWEAYVDNGRERTGINAIEWAKNLEKLGAGEIFLTSIDHEGTKKGFDLDLINAVNGEVTIPVIASGGAGCLDHFDELADVKALSGCAMASLLHYKIASTNEVRDKLQLSRVQGMEV